MGIGWALVGIGGHWWALKAMLSPWSSKRETSYGLEFPRKHMETTNHEPDCFARLGAKKSQKTRGSRTLYNIKKEKVAPVAIGLGAF